MWWGGAPGEGRAGRLSPGAELRGGSECSQRGFEAEDGQLAQRGAKSISRSSLANQGQV